MNITTEDKTAKQLDKRDTTTTTNTTTITTTTTNNNNDIDNGYKLTSENKKDFFSTERIQKFREPFTSEAKFRKT
jgi:hypothetical protein